MVIDEKFKSFENNYVDLYQEGSRVGFLTL